MAGPQQSLVVKSRRGVALTAGEPVGRGLSPQRRSLRWAILGTSTTLALGGFLYNQGYRLPFDCPLRHFTGLPCPTCGMSRSIAAAVRGDLATAVDYHLFGPVLLAVAAIATLESMLELSRRRPLPQPWSAILLRPKVYQGFWAVFLLYYVFRLFNGLVNGQTL